MQQVSQAAYPNIKHEKAPAERFCKAFPLSHCRITDYTADLSQSDVDANIAKALQLYSDVIPLDFKQIDSGTADIMIMFKSRGNAVPSVLLRRCLI